MPDVYHSKTTVVSPNIVDKIRKANWKKISKMLAMARDDQDLASNNLNLESSNINSVGGTKRFLQKVENDIGVKKINYT